MSSSSDHAHREVLQLATGAAACAVSTHWSNLAGLACTATAKSDNDADTVATNTRLAAPNVTHGLYRRDFLVPRVLLVDNNEAATAAPPALDVAALDAAAVYTGGPIQSLQLPQNGEDGDDLYSYRLTDPATTHAVHDDDEYGRRVGAASTLAYGPYSRYRVPLETDTLAARNNNRGADNTFSVASNGRHVAWDDDEEEPDEPDDDDWFGDHEREQRAQRQRQRQQRQRQDWYENTYEPLESQLQDFWNRRHSHHPHPHDMAAASHRENQPQQPQPLPQEEPKQSSTAQQSAATTTTTTKTSTYNDWRDYYLPPYHPQSILNWDMSGGTTTTTPQQLPHDFEQELEERLRHLLEDCHACQGVVLLCSSSGTSAANDVWSPPVVTTTQLQYLQDECPSAQRLVVTISEEEEEDPLMSSSNDETISWHTRNAVHRVRQPVQTGLAWQSFTELAHAILPLELPVSSSTSSAATAAAASAARVAAALECSTFPYRLDPTNNNHHSMVGLQSGHGFSGTYTSALPNFGTAPSLSFREWMGQLRSPTSNRQVVLELDALLQQPPSSSLLSPPQSCLSNVLQRGTSLERDVRMRQPGGMARLDKDILPGAWMLPAAATTAGPSSNTVTSNSSSNGGLLTCLSPLGRPSASSKQQTRATRQQQQQQQQLYTDRSRHYHFALAAALRPPSCSSSGARGRMGQQQLQQQLDTAQYLTCLMQGMGPRFRPEQTTATVVTQSLHQLVSGGGGGGYGAGSYWKSLLQQPQLQPRPCGSDNNNMTTTATNSSSRKSYSLEQMPVLAVLGNTTRRYGHLDQMANDMKLALSPNSSSQLRGFYNREVAQGTLPERDDCQEALAAAWDLRDVYTPPSEVLDALAAADGTIGFGDDL